MKYQRILIKLSGEALAGDGHEGIHDSKALFSIAKVISDIAKSGVEVAVVIGAGNICRGALVNLSHGIDRVTADKMGMLGTIINSFALADVLKSFQVNSTVLSAVKMEQFTETYSPSIADNYLKEKTIVIFGGGTGKPYFTTDTCAAMRAIEINAQAILMGKNGVDGIYSDDPRVNKNAKMYKTITCSSIIKENLKVMDLTAVNLLMNKDIDVRVFNMGEPENFIKVINGEDIGTTIMKG